MKNYDMDKSHLASFTLCCVSAVVAGLVPSTQAQVANLDPAPQNVFDNQREESLAKFLNAGPVSIRPHFNTTAYFDDNLTLRDGPEYEDLVLRLSPGALFGIGEFRGDKGNYVSLDYTATGSLYTKYDEYNSLDHLVEFDAGWRLARLTLGLGQSYEISNGKQIEAGAFIEQETYVTELTSRYDLSDKTSFELNGRQMLIDSTSRIIQGRDVRLNTINEWAVEGWGDYKVTEKVSVGAGAIFGWRDIRGYTTPVADLVDTPNQTFQQASVRSTYEVSEKLDVQGSVGIFFSQFQDGDDKSPTFVFSLGGSWQPLENTFVSLEGYRRDFPSYVSSGQNYLATGLRSQVRQLFLDKYSAALALGFENTDYTKDSSTAGGTDRSDNYFWVRPTLNYEVNDRLDAGVFYQFRTKNSDVAGLDYTNNQIGLFANYAF